MIRKAVRSVAFLVALVLVPGAVRAQVSDPLYLEAKRIFDALDYDNAIRALDQAIASLQARPVSDPVRQQLLPSAFEMRARSKFGNGDPDGAKADFVALLHANPAYTLTGDVSPRVVALFDAAVSATVTHLNLAVTPKTAAVTFDGLPITPGANIAVAVGDHTLAASQPGYRAVNQPVTVEMGKTADLSVTLERVASIVSVFTAPADVDVSVDGVKRGKTVAGQPPAAFADAIARSGVPASQVSAVLAINDLAPGVHTISFSRDCYVSTEQRLNITKPDDFTVGPVALQHAVASITARSAEANTHVFVDGDDRGAAPFTGELCEGDHTVELRSPTGRYVRRLTVQPGAPITVDGALRPGVALVSVVGQPAGADLRTVIGRAFDASRAMMLFSPPADQATAALRRAQLSDNWLSYDANKRPTGPADLGGTLRRDGAASLANTFGAQGVASLTVLDRNQAVLAILAAGADQPDVVSLTLDDAQSITDAVAQFDRLPAFSKTTVGLSTVDVEDVAGAVVVGVDANGAGAAAGLQAGDVISKINGAAVSGAAAFESALAARASGDTLAADIVDRTGAAKQVQLKVAMTPRLIGISDQTVLANRLLLALRARLAGKVDAAEEPAIRLNLAAALAHVGAWSDARTELQRVHLPDGPGVSNGTVQYLLGLCEQKLGNRAGAETAWKAAASSASLLTEDGPAISELAAARLAEIGSK